MWGDYAKNLSKNQSYNIITLNLHYPFTAFAFVAATLVSLRLLLGRGVGIRFSWSLQGSQTCGRSNQARTVPSVTKLSIRRKCETRLSRCLACQQTHPLCHPPPGPGSAECTCANCPNWSNLAYQSCSTMKGSTRSSIRQLVCQVDRWSHLVSFISDSAICQASHGPIDRSRPVFLGFRRL